MNAEERLRRRRQLYRLRRDRETPEEAEERRRRKENTPEQDMLGKGTQSCSREGRISM